MRNIEEANVEVNINNNPGTKSQPKITEAASDHRK